MTNARVLLLTVTRRERAAVLEVIGPAIGHTPGRSFAGDVLVFELGAIRTATLAVVQGGRSTADEAIRHWAPDAVVVTSLCCGLRNDWSPPQRLAEVIVATRIDDLDHRIAFSGHPDSDLLREGATGFDETRAHFGLVLSSRAPLDSPERREKLKAEHSRALGYEREAQDLYAAVTDARVRWAAVQGIADWGVNSDDEFAGDAAARNAAAFVLHTLQMSTIK